VLASEISDIKVLVAGDYVNRDRYEADRAAAAGAAVAATTAIFSKLDRIEDKLDKKADKP
jgi:hypothetical protein